ncbi:aldehyde dehydrogenase family protein [Budvicia diplopodorum]|uniref:aldehyde dehydrogenase family protein n=1 Tax=Budvicia diplopodorum TaxID=1119056 RepID=UPI001357BCA3|nr:aldehyde dehydrogenase family protein [Budvicia diplopodorum]
MNDLEISQAVANILGKYGATTGSSATSSASPTSANADVAPVQVKAEPEDPIAKMVAQILSETTAQSASRATVPAPASIGFSASAADASNNGIFSHMDRAIEAAHIAQRQYSLCSMADRASFIKGIRDAFSQQPVLEQLSRMAVEETGMGNFHDKVIKNRVAVLQTPGVEDLVTQACSGDSGLTLVEYSAYGVIGSITPTTNPTETIICNAIGMLAAGNCVVFSPHPRSKQVSLLAIAMINQKLAELGAPANLVTTVEQPSIDSTNQLMKHPKVRMLVATGGPAIVNTVMSSGKKAIGAGAGNPPVVVDETANIEKAAKDIVNGCSFDNNMPCVAEKELLVVDQVADFLIHYMKKNGAYLLSDRAQIQKLQDLVLNEKATGPNTAFVGKGAVYILEKLNISAPADTKIILLETDKTHPFVVHELMMPILPLVRVDNVDAAIDLAIELEQGNRHTAIMHSTNVEKLTKMAKLIQTTIFVKNGPSYAGLGVGGEGYTTFTIAGPTGEGLTSAKSFARMRRCVMVESLNIR